MNDIPLYNPLNYTFTYEMLDDENNAHEYTMPPLEITYFDPLVARFMKKHLADAVYHKLGEYTNYEDDMRQVIKRIEVEI